MDNGQELDGSVQGFSSLVRIFAYGWEECNPKAFSAKGIVMVGAGLSRSVVVSVGCRLWMTRALKEFAMREQFLPTNFGEWRAGRVAHLSHFEPLK